MGLYKHTLKKEAAHALILKSRIIRSLGLSAGILLSGVNSFCPCLRGVLLECAENSVLTCRGAHNPNPRCVQFNLKNPRLQAGCLCVEVSERQNFPLFQSLLSVSFNDNKFNYHLNILQTTQQGWTENQSQCNCCTPVALH